MVWAGISFNGNTQLAFVSPKSNSIDYQEILQSFSLPVIYETCGINGEFQQDNASIHVSQSSKKWLNGNGIKTIDWPARSPDLNPIENVWAELSRAVYKNGRQFDNKNDLKNAIETEWNLLDQIKIQNLIMSMTNRLVEVIQKNGAQTHY